MARKSHYKHYLAYGVVLVALVLCLVPFSLQVHSVAKYGDIYDTTGGESYSLIGIWKVIHGHVLYEDPLGETLSSQSYNFLFYYTYGLLLFLLGIEGDALILFGRLITVAFAALGLLIHISLILSVGSIPLRSKTACAVAALSIWTWFGNPLVSIWTLTVRPDMGALVCILLGVFACIQAIRKNDNLGLCVLAALFFWLAWGFKQSAVWTYVGSVLFFLFPRRNIRAAGALVVPFAALLSSSLLAGGKVYIYNTIVLMSLPGTLPFSANLMKLRYFFIEGFLVWALLCYMLLALAWRRFRSRRTNLEDRSTAEKHWDRGPMVYLIWAWIPPLLFGLIGIRRTGSALNTAFEAFIIAALICGVLLSRWLSTARRDVPVSTAIPMALLVVSSVLSIANARDPSGLRTKTRMLRQTFHGSANSAALRRQLIQTHLPNLPKPIYAEYPILNLPWHSTDDRYPPLSIYELTYSEAVKRKMLPPTAFKDFVERQGIKTIIFRTDKGGLVNSEMPIPGFHEISVPRLNSIQLAKVVVDFTDPDVIQSILKWNPPFTPASLTQFREWLDVRTDETLTFLFDTIGDWEPYFRALLGALRQQGLPIRRAEFVSEDLAPDPLGSESLEPVSSRILALLFQGKIRYIVVEAGHFDTSPDRPTDGTAPGSPILRRHLTYIPLADGQHQLAILDEGQATAAHLDIVLSTDLFAVFEVSRIAAVAPAD